MNKIVFITLILINFSLTSKTLPIGLFLKDPDIVSLKVSPDGKHYAALVMSNGETKLSILSTADNKIIHTIDFKRKKQEIGDYGWYNSNRVYATMIRKVGPLAQPRGTGYLYAVDIDGKQKRQLMPSKARKNDKHYRGYTLLHHLPFDNNHIMISEPDDMYSVASRLNINTGQKVRVDKSPAKHASLSVDNAGNVRISQSISELGDKVTIHLKDSDNQWRIFKEFDSKSVDLHIISFTKDNNKAFIELKNKEYKRGIYTLDLVSKDISLIMPINNDADIIDFIYDLDYKAGELIGIKQMKDYISFSFFDNQHFVAKLYRSFAKSFKEESVEIKGITENQHKAIVFSSSDKNPGSYYSFDLKTYKMELLFDIYPWIDRQQMASMKPISFTTRDGLEIRGYLTLPNNKSKNLPLIVFVHGGPFGVSDSWGYNREVQLLANNGYAVLQVNYRGSGGRGSDFVFDAYKKVGKEMQDDLTDATLWAVQQGIADKNRLCISGASYGGYAAIQGVVREPDLYKCAVGYAGLYDINLAKKSASWQSKRGRKFVREAWGIDDKDFVFERSPIFHTDKIKANVFLVHGKDDYIVRFENFTDLKKQFKKTGVRFIEMAKPYEGHGFYDYDNNIELYTKMLDFFKKNISNK